MNGATSGAMCIVGDFWGNWDVDDDVFALDDRGPGSRSVPATS